MIAQRFFMPVFAALLMIALGGNGAAANAASRQKTTRQLVNLEQLWLSHRNDSVVLARVLADDFVHVLPSGFINKSQ